MSLDNPMFRAYLFYCSVLILKMLIMAPLTARQRYAKKASIFKYYYSGFHVYSQSCFAKIIFRSYPLLNSIFL